VSAPGFFDFFFKFLIFFKFFLFQKICPRVKSQLCHVSMLVPRVSLW